VAEVELKFQIPEPRLQGVRAALERGRITPLRLRAIYFDTPQHHLAQAGLALRLRREGTRWVQTLKGRGDAAWSRLEHEVDLGSVRSLRGAVPALDLARHAGTPEGQALTAALDGHADALAAAFEIDVLRRQRVLRHAGALVEVALDIGTLRCAHASVALREIEFELKAGPLASMTALAARWAERHRLWLDARSKAERGHLLARNASASDAVTAERPAVREGDLPDPVLRACVGAALMHLLPNASALNAGTAGPEHVHQARVALRRLISVLREFGTWSAAADPQWIEAAHTLFTALGGTRDRDALEAWVLPRLREAGAPWWELVPAAAATAPPIDLFASAAATRWLLDLIAFAGSPGAPAADAGEPLALARPRLKRLYRQLQRTGEDFAGLPEDQRHRARKRLKRLRYAAESLSALWPAEAWQRCARRLQAAQDALGRLQDLSVAEAACRHALDNHEPRAWFALGWLATVKPQQVARAGKALKALGKTPKFLR
jgi:inorganic triphosphatase YgiF